MIFSIAELIETISVGITLQPGDILATGTPSGEYPWLQWFHKLGIVCPPIVLYFMTLMRRRVTRNNGYGILAVSNGEYAVRGFDVSWTLALSLGLQLHNHIVKYDRLFCCEQELDQDSTHHDIWSPGTKFALRLRALVNYTIMWNELVCWTHWESRSNLACLHFKWYLSWSTFIQTVK